MSMEMTQAPAPPQDTVKTASAALVTKGDRMGIQDALRIEHHLAFAPDTRLTASDPEKYQLLAQEMQGLTIFENGQRVPLAITAESIVQTHNLLKDLQENSQFGGLWILCDGMGGEAKGDIAANLVLTVIQHEILPAVLDGTISSDSLLHAIETANDVLLQYTNLQQQKNKDPNWGTGTTVLATLTDKNGTTHCASYGDSRMFLRGAGGKIRQINLDTSEVTGKVLTGEIKPSQIYTDPRRNWTVALPQARPFVQMESIRLNPGEQIIMTSDGVWEAVLWNHNPELGKVINFYLEGADREYANFLAQGIQPREALQKVQGLLFQKINLYGVPNDAPIDQIVTHLTREEVGDYTQDNATAIAIEASSAAQEPTRKTAEYFRAGYRFYTFDKTNTPVEAQVCGYDPVTGGMIIKTGMGNQENWQIVPREQVQHYQAINPPENDPVATNARTWEELEKAVAQYTGFFKNIVYPDGENKVLFTSGADMLGAFAGLRKITDPPETLKGRLGSIPAAARARAIDLMKQMASRTYYNIEGLATPQPAA